MPFSVVDLVQYQDHSIVSRTLLKKAKGNVTLFAFDKDEFLSEHTTPHEALLWVLEGEMQVTIGSEEHQLSRGSAVILPPNEPHAVRALTRSKMVLVMIHE